MRHFQIFQRTPSDDLILRVLHCFGLEGFEDTQTFTKQDLHHHQTVSRMHAFLPELKTLYVPCKAKIFLTNLQEKTCLTILRQLLRVVYRKLVYTEKVLQRKKYMLYRIECMDTPCGLRITHHQEAFSDSSE